MLVFIIISRDRANYLVTLTELEAIDQAISYHHMFPRE